MHYFIKTKNNNCHFNNLTGVAPPHPLQPGSGVTTADSLNSLANQ